MSSGFCFPPMYLVVGHRFRSSLVLLKMKPGGPLREAPGCATSRQGKKRFWRPLLPSMLTPAFPVSTCHLSVWTDTPSLWLVAGDAAQGTVWLRGGAGSRPVDQTPWSASSAAVAPFGALLQDYDSLNSDPLYWLPVAAVTNYRTFRGLTPRTFLVSQCPWPRV